MNGRSTALRVGQVLCALSVLAAPFASGAEAPPILESETATVASLRPLQDHDLLLGSFFGVGHGALRFIDGDSGDTLAQLYTAYYANFALAPDNKYVYVAETYWSRGNRGTRSDLLSVYDGTTLQLLREIPLPGRLISDPKHAAFNLSADGHYAYVYNFQPAASVVVVDLQANKVLTTVEVPGCGLVFPFAARGFASLCADGSLATATINDKGHDKGKYAVTRSAVFFDVNNDPIFDDAVLDRQSDTAFFLSYTGLVYEVKLGATPVIAKPWSIQQAAGLTLATTQVGHITWRPCGEHLLSYHRSSGRLFVLMQESTHWDYEKGGVEVWVLDVKTHQLLARHPLPQPTKMIAVTQDANPILFAVTENWLWMIDPATGALLRSVHDRIGELVAVKGF